MSTVPVIRIRAPAANSISIAPPLVAGVTGPSVGLIPRPPLQVQSQAGRHPSAQAETTVAIAAATSAKRHTAALLPRLGAAPVSSPDDLIADSYGRTYDKAEEHDAYYLASATLLPKEAIVTAVSKKRSSEQIAEIFGTSSELVDYRIKRLGLWREHVGKQIRLSSD
ncbi:hypothetical protein GGD67_007350 [Bradyrhizobium sp. IAR9]|uniref:ImmA/IrrE family metallo-endopeptidase n=1 Tax=Bradyrhizobium sp. IAR9 TaxID=2663841 RepID=UPI0017C5C008|nr:ImmA/IrrE family metallo-endopeptidase [Bradyrhizobium sp. IAR9]NYG49851.1 hypothetical protein [Bradyrhizobium sp. IAR9]